MFLNRLKCIICLGAVIFVCNVTIAQGASSEKPVQIEQKEKIYDFLQTFFMYCANEMPFEKKWASVWGPEIEHFFGGKIPPEFHEFDNDISFAGEFIRFQFDSFLNRHQEKYSIDIYILPRKSATYNFVRKQFSMINIPCGNQIFEYFVRFNVMNFGDRNRGIIPLNFYIGLVVFDSGTIRLEYCEFLANGKLALNGKIPVLENISQAILDQYVKWLLSQKRKYEKFRRNR